MFLLLSRVIPLKINLASPQLVLVMCGSRKRFTTVTTGINESCKGYESLGTLSGFHRNFHWKVMIGRENEQ